MRALMAMMAGAGLPLALAGALAGVGWATQAPALKFAGAAGAVSSGTLGALGAVLGLLVIRRRVSPTPFRDVLQLSSALAGVLTLVAILPISHAEGFLTALVCLPAVFLPGPAAAWIAARLWQASRRRALDRGRSTP